MLRCPSFVAAAILAGAALRLGLLWQTPTVPMAELDRVANLLANRSVLTDAIDPPLRSLGVDQMAWERFDPNALVVIAPGPDGQPGTAGVDDNANGIVDDQRELGATRTDDVCSVYSADAADDLSRRLVLQRGAFVPTTAGELRSLPADAQIEARAVVTGHSADDYWSFLVPLR